MKQKKRENCVEVTTGSMAARPINKCGRQRYYYVLNTLSQLHGRKATKIYGRHRYYYVGQNSVAGCASGRPSHKFTTELPTPRRVLTTLWKTCVTEQKERYLYQRLGQRENYLYYIYRVKILIKVRKHLGFNANNYHSMKASAGRSG